VLNHLHLNQCLSQHRQTGSHGLVARPLGHRSQIGLDRRSYHHDPLLPEFYICVTQVCIGTGYLKTSKVLERVTARYDGLQC
jgi:hypothetical protein